MAGLTLQQLQAMGAKPVTPTPSSGGLTLDQIKNMGGTPVMDPYEEMLSKQATFGNYKKNAGDILDESRKAFDDIKAREDLGITDHVSATLQKGGESAKGLLKQIGLGIRTLSPQALNEAMGSLADAIGTGIKWGQDKLSDSTTFQKIVGSEPADRFANFLDEHPDLGRNAQAVVDIANLPASVVGAGDAAVLGKNLIKKGLEKGTELATPVFKYGYDATKDAVSSGASKVAQTAPVQKVAEVANDFAVKNSTDEAIQNILNPTKNLDNSLKSKITITIKDAKGNLKQVPLSKATDEEIAASQLEKADRLQQYQKMAENHKNNPELDSPLTGSVTKNIAKYTEQVDNLRKAVGNKIGQIEEKYKDTVIPLTDKTNQIVTKLSDELKTKYGGEVKDAGPAQKAIEQFFDLQNNGLNVGERMEFVRGWQKYLEDQKDGFGVFKENRYVNTQIQDLVNAIKQETRSGIKDSTYQTFVKKYAEYSQFRDEANRLLGDKTLLGNARKGASIAKRAVQSIADGGSKDFLLQLKKITGYNGFEDAVLALKAMNDAGVTNAGSLLENTAKLVSEGVPTDKLSLIKKGIGFAAKKVLGDEANQTSNFVKATPEQIRKAKEILKKRKGN